MRALALETRWLTKARDGGCSAGTALCRRELCSSGERQKHCGATAADYGRGVRSGTEQNGGAELIKPVCFGVSG